MHKLFISVSIYVFKLLFQKNTVDICKISATNLTNNYSVDICKNIINSTLKVRASRVHSDNPLYNFSAAYI